VHSSLGCRSSSGAAGLWRGSAERSAARGRAIRGAQAVDELLAALGARGDERVPVPAWHYEDAAPADARADGRMPLREALSKCYDLRRAPCPAPRAAAGRLSRALCLARSCCVPPRSGQRCSRAPVRSLPAAARPWQGASSSH